MVFLVELSPFIIYRNPVITINGKFSLFCVFFFFTLSFLPMIDLNKLNCYLDGWLYYIQLLANKNFIERVKAVFDSRKKAPHFASSKYLTL